MYKRCCGSDAAAGRGGGNGRPLWYACEWSVRRFKHKSRVGTWFLADDAEVGTGGSRSSSYILGSGASASKARSISADGT